jgi:hypothetical protein
MDIVVKREPTPLIRQIWTFMLIDLDAILHSFKLYERKSAKGHNVCGFVSVCPLHKVSSYHKC